MNRTGCRKSKNFSACPNYSYNLQRCKLGRIIPRTVSGGVEAARVMGFSYICSLSAISNKVLDKLLKQNLEAL